MSCEILFTIYELNNLCDWSVNKQINCNYKLLFIVHVIDNKRLSKRVQSAYNDDCVVVDFDDDAVVVIRGTGNTERKCDKWVVKTTIRN